MKIPDSLLKKLEAIEKKNREYEEAKERGEKAEKEKLERIDQYRQVKMPVLVSAVEKILDWVREFRGSSEGQRILKAWWRVNLYAGKFWGGEPIPATTVTCCAVLCLNKNGKMLYQEKHKGGISRELDVSNAKKLIEELHPDFVLEAAKAIEDGSVWKHMEN